MQVAHAGIIGSVRLLRHRAAPHPRRPPGGGGPLRRQRSLGGADRPREDRHRRGGRAATCRSRRASARVRGLRRWCCSPPRPRPRWSSPRRCSRGGSRWSTSPARSASPTRRYPTLLRLRAPRPRCSRPAVYGLPELFRGQIASARLVANPGCYPTAAALVVVPLLRAGLLADESIVIDAASGVSGAGRQATEAYSFCEVADDVRAYKVAPAPAHAGDRPDAPPVARATCRLVFTPHLLPIKRGILCTASARLEPRRQPGAVADGAARTPTATSRWSRLLRHARAVRHRRRGRHARGAVVGADSASTRAGWWSSPPSTTCSRAPRARRCRT